MQIWHKHKNLHKFLSFYTRFSLALIPALAFSEYTRLRLTMMVQKQIGAFPMGAAIYS